MPWEFFQKRILFALNKPRPGASLGPGRVSHRHIYGGTVPVHVKARRRARNKVARLSRRANRA